MTAHRLVDPSKIEKELIQIWEGIANEKTRACLFNLIVYNELSERTDYIHTIVQRVSEKYPCRVLFISLDPKASPYLKTAVSVVGNGSIACDFIDIGVAGTEKERVPFVVLSHLIPDLPVSLLWTADPTQTDPLFTALSKWSTRVIFDSESADNLFAFSSKVLELKKPAPIDYADLNWARIEGWRNLLTSAFDTPEKLPLLQEISKVEITYSARSTPFFCHLKIQAMYLLAWLSSRLHWKWKSSSSNLTFQFQKQTAAILQDTTWEEIGPGTLIAIEFTTQSGHKISCSRIKGAHHRVNIEVSTPEKCDLPTQFLLGQVSSGQSLVKEIITQGTSPHFLEVLKEVQQLDRDHLC